LNLIDKIFPHLPEKEILQHPAFSSARLLRFMISFLQLAALFYFIDKFNIEEGSGIGRIYPAILCAFTLNSFLPLRFRPALLFATNIFFIYFAFGLFSGSLLIATGIALILCCHLPIKFIFRILFILAIATGLFILRADLYYAPRGSLVAPFLASMFMFRLIIYLYEVKHGMLPATIFQRIVYFFLFPNICFLFFPIIDYKTYIKTYYDKQDDEIWQKGIRWMLRGVVHIIAYRILYYYVVISPNEVTGMVSALRYILSSYALILRLSGLFHLIIGMLCMFGLNLPQAFNNYFLATGFTDLWRRINIYWREFILKIFFYPLMFKLKKKLKSNVLQITIMSSFIITWALHAYQWFWIRGYYVFNPLDIIFWIVLGIGITISSTIQEKRLQSPPKENSNSRLIYFSHMLKMIGMILFMSVMWALWGSSNFEDWYYLMSKFTIFSSTELLAVIAVIILLIGLGFFIQILLEKQRLKDFVNLQPHRTLFLTLPVIFILLSFTFITDKKFNPGTLPAFVQSLAGEKLNRNDKKNEEDGYYKRLIDGDNNNATGLWEVNLKRPRKFNSMDDIYIRTDDLLTKVFKPSSKITGNNYTLETNSFGLRDKDYSAAKPSKTFRMALLGGSYEMGSGVNNPEVFESIVEERLNKENTDSLNYEILNFACGGFYLIQHVELCDTKVFKYDPDAVVYVAHTGERWRLILTLTNLIRQGTNLKYPLLENLKTVTGVKQSMSKTEIEDRLRPYTDKLIKWTYEQIAYRCRQNNAVPVWGFLPATGDSLDRREFEAVKKMAADLNFVILDLRKVYGNADIRSLQLSEWNTHPNAKGHRMIADEFYKEFLKSKKLIVRKTR
jgi:D-alanyl-lipoteichoic acid acyltransferase DltB (MBOAT superfamily)